MWSKFSCASTPSAACMLFSMRMRHQKAASPLFSTYTRFSTRLSGSTFTTPSAGKGAPPSVSSWSIISSRAVVITLRAVS